MYFRLLLRPAWTVTLAWDPVPDPEVAGYRIYYRSEDEEVTDDDPGERHIDVGNATAGSVSLPLESKRCRLAVTSYTVLGVESDRSAEVTVNRPQLPF